MSLLPHRDSKNQYMLTGLAAFAACFGALFCIHLKNQNSTTDLYYSNVPAVSSSSRVVSQQYVLPRSQVQNTVDISTQYSPEVDQDVEEVVMVEQGHAASPLYTLGLTALCTSALLAAAGAGLRTLSSFQTKPSPLSFMEMIEVDDAISMAAATSAKGSAKATAKASKAVAKAAKKRVQKEKKAAKAEKKEREPIVRTPQEVMEIMRKAAIKRVKKDTKTTGRVCQILGKVDNRQARAISFSHRRTRRVQKVNLHWRRLWWEEGKCFVLLRLSTKGIKTVTRYGLHQAAIKFGLDLTKNINGTSERKYVKYLPEKEKKLAMIRGARARYLSAVRMARLNGDELPEAPAGVRPVKIASAPPSLIAMAISHGCKMPQLSKPADQRKALLRSLTTELIRHGRIKTTLIRAKAMRKHVDRMISLAKEGTLHSRRQAIGYIYDKDLVHTLFEQVPERYGARDGGYTRIIRTLPRKGDAAKMCYIELV